VHVLENYNNYNGFEICATYIFLFAFCLLIFGDQIKRFISCDNRLVCTVLSLTMRKTLQTS
jgi:hypothetical protein